MKRIIFFVVTLWSFFLIGCYRDKKQIEEILTLNHQDVDSISIMDISGGKRENKILKDTASIKQIIYFINNSKEDIQRRSNTTLMSCDVYLYANNGTVYDLYFSITSSPDPAMYIMSRSIFATNNAFRNKDFLKIISIFKQAPTLKKNEH